MEAKRGFSRPIVPAFLSSGKYYNCLRENVIVGAEQDNFDIFFDSYSLFTAMQRFRAGS